MLSYFENEIQPLILESILGLSGAQTPESQKT